MQDMNADKNLDYQKMTEVFRLTYNAKGSACETGVRIATSTEQLCQNLQVAEQNNSCAEEGREILFNQRCKDQKWSPANASLRLLADSNIKCSASSPKGHVNSQILSGGSLVLVHDRFFAVISRVDQKINLKILNAYPIGETLAESTQAIDQTPIKVETRDGLARVECSSI